MASKRHLRRRTCTDKRRFESKDEAQNGINGLRKRGLRGLMMVAYQCKFCGGWHIGRTKTHGRSVKLWQINQSGY